MTTATRKTPATPTRPATSRRATSRRVPDGQRAGRPKAGRTTAEGRPAKPARGGIHPRFRQRWVAVKKAEGRRRLRWLGSVAAVLAVVAGGWGLTRSPVLDVDEVRVTGAERTLLATLIEAGKLEPGTAMVDIDPSAAVTALEALPWVETATVERLWPGSVAIGVAERSPVVGLALPDGRWSLADATGRVLEWQDGPPAGLPHVHDAGRIPQPGNQLEGPAAGAARVAAALPGSLRTLVGGVNIRGRFIELALNAGGVVRLGSPDREVSEKLRAAATVLKRVGPENVAVLDVTVPRSPVLARG